MLSEADTADVTISGREADLISLFRGTLSPAKALLFGKIKVKGDLGALSAFASFLG